MALWYTSGLTSFVGPIVMIWPQLLPKALLDRFEGLSSAALAGTVALIVLSFAAVTLLHYLLLSLFTPSKTAGAGTAVKSPA